ncbi:MAG: CDP-alcohol phosphatidyltransferase family protein [Muribaculaceae bacterium]|nr:CDP-alcohol phosphatidyltransferase family protein [Muribaculaceae bacterium]
MSTKNTFKKKRDGIQQGIYFVINPFVKLLIRMGVTPNIVTTIGLLGNLAAACIIAWAGYCATKDPNHIRFDLITWGGVVTIAFSLFDMLDGQVARLGNMVSRFGALYDSVLDRYCELLTLGALSYFLIMTGYPIGALITFVALVGSVMVSYVRARAEGVGIECKVGFMQRPERVVVTTLGCLACGIVGVASPNTPHVAILILIIAMSIIAVFANITAFARVGVCRAALADDKADKGGNADAKADKAVKK